MSTDPEQLAVAARVRDARGALGLTQQQVADASGIDRVALANVELGMRRINALELRRLARALRTTMAQLLGFPDHGAPSRPCGRVTTRAARSSRPLPHGVAR